MDFDFDTETISPETGSVISIGSPGSLRIPIGTTAERPFPSLVGMVRWSTSNANAEIHDGLNWNPLITNVFGTTNQVTVVGSGPGVTLSTPSVFIAPGSLEYSTHTGNPLQSLAATGTTQATAALVTLNTVVVSAGSANSGIRLQTPTLIGQTHTVINKTAVVIQVYPQVGGSFASGAVNDYCVISAGRTLSIQWDGSAWSVLQPNIIAGAGVGVSYSAGDITITNSGLITVADDTTTATAFYPTMSTVTSGTLGSVKTSSTKLFYTPSTGLLNSTSMNSTSFSTFEGIRVGKGASAVTANTAIGVSALTANTTGNNNTAVGYATLTGNTTGNNNTAFGYGTLYQTITGINNTAVGYAAVYSSTSGSQNVGVGGRALFTNITGASNVAIGYNSLQLATGSNNVGVGTSTMSATTSGINNTAIGTSSLAANTTGSYNTGVGLATIGSNTTGANNTAVGYAAMNANTTGNNNVAMGFYALNLGTTGAGNTAVGYYSMSAANTGANNAAFGASALQSNTTGYSNVGAGGAALSANTTGYSNTAVGQGAGNTITTGSMNTIIGRYTGNMGGLDIRTANGWVVISDGSGNPRQVIDPSGNVGIGTIAPAYKLEVAGSFAAVTKSFLIDHPTKAGMKLCYGSLESPYHGVRLTGQATIDTDTSVVRLPDYIVGLCKQDGAQVQITNIRHGHSIWVESIDILNNCFTVSTKRGLFNRTPRSFFWSFTGIRKDIADIQVEC